METRFSILTIPVQLCSTLTLFHDSASNLQTGQQGCCVFTFLRSMPYDIDLPNSVLVSGYLAMRHSLLIPCALVHFMPEI